MGKSFTAEVFAKVNLALSVEGNSAKYPGKHELSSVIVPFTAFSDKVTLTPRGDGAVTVAYTDGRTYAQDRIYEAARALQNKYAADGADIVVDKRIPEGVGLGSSSAAVAALLNCFAEAYGIRIAPEEAALYGADVPVQIAAKPGKGALVRGIGEIVTPVKLPKLYLTLVFGDERAETRDVFHLYDLIGGAGGDVSEFAENLLPFNALEAAATELCPGAKRSRCILCAAGYDKVVMTGSGTGYVGIAESKEEQDILYGRAEALAKADGRRIYKATFGEGL